MEFRKHHIKPGVKKMLEVQKFNDELADLLDDARKAIYAVEFLVAHHQDRVRCLHHRSPEDGEEYELALLNGIKEFAYLGYITKRIKNIDKMIVAMGHSDQNMLMFECVEDLWKEEKKHEPMDKGS